MQSKYFVYAVLDIPSIGCETVEVGWQEKSLQSRFARHVAENGCGAKIVEFYTTDSTSPYSPKFQTHTGILLGA